MTNGKLARRRRGPRLLLAVCTGALTLALSAGIALAAGHVWMSWVYTGANGHQYGGAQSELHQVAVQPAINRWGCANIYLGPNHRLFSDYYCGTSSGEGKTPYVDGQNARPEAWNDWSKGQDLWAWEDIN